MAYATRVVPSFDPTRYWEKRHAQNDGLAAVGYLGMNAFNHWAYRVRRRVFQRALRPHRLEGARALDVGSGTGFYLDLWNELPVARVVGSDFSEVAVGRLKQDHPGTQIEQLDITAEDPTAFDHLGTFDFVSAMDVLYHIVDDALYQRAFQNLARLLRPGGHLVFTENFLQNTPRSGNAWQVSRKRTEIELALRTAQLTLISRRPGFVLMNGPVDSSSRLHTGAWWLIRKASGRSYPLSYVLGATLYPPEIVLTRVLRESPTSEIAVAKR